jgi:hypothetical protein
VTEPRYQAPSPSQNTWEHRRMLCALLGGAGKRRDAQDSVGTIPTVQGGKCTTGMCFRNTAASNWQSAGAALGSSLSQHAQHASDCAVQRGRIRWIRHFINFGCAPRRAAQSPGSARAGCPWCRGTPPPRTGTCRSQHTCSARNPCSPPCSSGLHHHQHRRRSRWWLHCRVLAGV